MNGDDDFTRYITTKHKIHPFIFWTFTLSHAKKHWRRMEWHRCSPARGICGDWKQIYFKIKSVDTFPLTTCCMANIIEEIIPWLSRYSHDRMTTKPKKDLEKVVVISSKVKQMTHRAYSLLTRGRGTLPTLPLCSWFPVEYQVFMWTFLWR